MNHPTSFRLPLLRWPALLTAACLALAPAAQAASYMKLEGVKGNVSSSHTALSWQWLHATASGGFDPFQPAFAGGVWVAAGDVEGDGTGLWESIELVAVDDGSAAELRYELQNVIVSSYSVSGHGGDGGAMHIDSWARATLRWLPEGAGGGGPAMHWDWATRSADGDLAALAGFAALGAERWPDGTLVLTSAVPEPSMALLMGMGGLALWLRRRVA